MEVVKFEWRGKEITDKNKANGLRGLTNGGEIVLDASNQKAPLDEGVLVATGNVSSDEQSMSVVISYD